MHANCKLQQFLQRTGIIALILNWCLASPIRSDPMVYLRKPVIEHPKCSYQLQLQQLLVLVSDSMAHPHGSGHVSFTTSVCQPETEPTISISSDWLFVSVSSISNCTSVKPSSPTFKCQVGRGLHAYYQLAASGSYELKLQKEWGKSCTVYYGVK